MCGAGRRRVLGRAVHAHDGDSEASRPVGDGAGDRRAPQADVAHQLQVPRTQRGVVEEARQEVGGAAARAQPARRHVLQDLPRVPHVGEVDGLAPVQREQQPREHPYAVGDRGPRQRGPGTGGLQRPQLADLAHQGAMGVHDPLGVRGGARRVGDGRRAPRVHGNRTGQLRAVQQPGERDRARGRRSGVERRPVAVDHGHHLEVGQVRAEQLQGGEVVEVTEPVRGDQGSSPRLAEDVGHLLGPVEVHDGDEHRAQEAGRVERDGRLEPVRELEGDHVTWVHPPGPEPAGRGSRQAGDVGQGPVPGPGEGVDAKVTAPGSRQTGGQDLAQGLVPPPSLPVVEARQVRRDLPQMPVRRHGVGAASAARCHFDLRGAPALEGRARHRPRRRDREGPLPGQR